MYHDEEEFIHGMQGWFNIWISINISHHITKKGEKPITSIVFFLKHFTTLRSISLFTKKKDTPQTSNRDFLNLRKHIYENHSIIIGDKTSMSSHDFHSIL